MMQIVLLRHGRPNVPEHGKLRAHELHQWIDSYNSAGLVPDQVPSQAALEIAKTCKVVVCSDLPRSIESAQALGVREIKVVEPMFREMGLPYSQVPFFRMAPHFWAAFFRALWFLGYCSHSESLSEAKTRAAQGARRLRDLAAKNESVLLVGHGFVNSFIAKELLSKGWTGPTNPGKRYWELGALAIS